MPSNRVVPGMKVPPHPLLAEGVVVSVGDAVAAAVADTAYHARDAADLVAMEYEPLPPVATAEAALAAGAPVVHEAVGGNLSFSHRWRGGCGGRLRRRRARGERAHAPAARGRGLHGAARHCWPARSRLRRAAVWTSTQAPFRVRAEIAAVPGYPESRIRVIAPEVGGGFGVKGSPYREDALVAWLALRLRRPVKWIATRGEDLLTTQHGRGAEAEGALAVDAPAACSGCAPAWSIRWAALRGQRGGARVELRAHHARPLRGARGGHRGRGRRSPRPRPPAPIAARVAPRAPSSSSGSWTRRRMPRASIPRRSGAATSCRPMPFPIGPPPAWSTTRAATARRSTPRSSWPAMTASAAASARRARGARWWAWGWWSTWSRRRSAGKAAACAWSARGR